MAYNTKYKIQYTEAGGKEIEIDFQEDGFAGSVTDLICVNAELEWAQFDKVKDFGIKQSRLKMSILCNDTLLPETFITTSETQYKVILYVNNVANWYGWLDSTDLSFPFLDGNVQVELFARDGLHLLSSAKLEVGGSEPWIFYTIKDLLRYWLELTGLSLNYWTWINIYPDGTTARSIGTPSNDPTNYTYVSYKTFQEDDPFTALNKVVTGLGCQLFQARGKWHLVYVEDWIRDIGLYGTEWNSSGTAQGIASAQRFNFTIGLNENYKLINEDAVKSYQPAVKGVRMNYNYEVPRLLRNQDLLSGDFLAFDSGNLYALYNPVFWTYSGSGTMDTKTIAQLDIVDDVDSEDWRRVTFRTNSSTASGQIGVLTSSSIPCQAGDYFTFKFNHGAETISYSRVLFCQIKLYRASPAADMYLKADGKWTTTVTFLNVQGASGSIGTPTDPLAETFSNVDPIPDNATALEIIFTLENQGNPTPSGTYLYFISNMDFQYEAYTSTNTIYRGQYNKIENSATLRNYTEENTYISDSQNLVFKGTIINSTSVILRYWFHNGVTEKVRFSKMITYANYRLRHRNFVVLEGSFLNTISATNNYLLSPLDTAFFSEIPSSEFCVCTLTLNLVTNQAIATFNELHDGTDFSITGTESFGLIDKTERRIVEQAVEEVKQPINFRFGVLGFLVQKLFTKKKR